ncbi:MAG: isopeptide-forming domain-containing fimbrial protein [Ruminococcus sp.]|nr:isopeptide-forming domain-containing fimbrial protein [Ruminococcus sp.]
MKKTNKTFKRFAAITSASLLAACAVAPAFTSAEDKPFTITVNETETGHEYSAYQIFKGTVDGNTMTGITWGDGVNSATVTGANNDLIDELNALTIGTPDIFEGLSDAASVANAISQLANGDSNVYGDLDKVATVFAKYAATAKATSSYAESKYTLSFTNSDDADKGYYLVLDGEKGDGSKAISKYILKVLGDSEITVKKDAPEVIKKIKENDYNGDTPTFDGEEMSTDVGYNDTADYCIGDYVPFKLYGSLPSTLGNYEKYKYVFHDTMDEQFGNPENVVVKIKVEGTWYYVKEVNTIADATGYKKTIAENNNDMDISFADIKNVNLYTDAECTTLAVTGGTSPVAIRPNANSIVTVEYDAQLKSSAELGTPGQKNAVKLEYAYNSNYRFEGDGIGDDDAEEEYNETPTTETPFDTVIAFTYQLDLTKVDGKNPDKTLKDANFVLRRTVDTATQYAVLEGSTIVDWVSPTGTVTIDTDAGTIASSAGWTPVNSTEEGLVPTVVTTPEDGKFSFIGLDADEYELVEIKAPSGYKIPETGKVFALEVEADTSNSQNDSAIDGTELISLTLNGTEGKLADGNLETGVLATQITNTSSAELPGTGGIGTTIFYLGGGAMAAIGGIYLISKRRMRKSEE